MKKAFSVVVCGLLWLAFSGMSFGDSLTIQSYNFSANGDGGGFLAYLNGNTSNPLEVFCVDYLNEVDPPQTYDVNVSTPNLSNPDDGLGDTRYGTTPETSFSFQSVTGGAVSTSLGTYDFGDAYDRYVMAAYLTTLYNLSDPNSGTNNDIQIAIWTLLDTNGAVLTPNSPGTSTGVASELVAAVEFMDNASAFNSFASEVEIFTSSSVATADIPSRYQNGQQEMIMVVPPNAVPEPADFAMVGTGLLLLGALRRRKS